MASLDGRSVTYGVGELDTLVPAYAANTAFCLTPARTHQRRRRKAIRKRRLVARFNDFERI